MPPLISTLGVASARGFGFGLRKPGVSKTIVQSAVNSASTALTSFTLAHAPQAGNLLLLFLEGQTTPVPPSGFTQFGTTGTISTNIGRIYSKVASASEPTTYSFSTGAYAAYSFAEIGGATAIDNSSGVTSFSGASVTIPSISASSTYDLCLVMGWTFGASSAIGLPSPYTSIVNGTSSTWGLLAYQQLNTATSNTSVVYSASGMSEGNLAVVLVK